MSSQLLLTALPRIPLVQHGDNLTALILDGLKAAELTLQTGDMIVLAQKIVSKAEGRMVDLEAVVPSERAQEIAEITLKDPRLIELILSESTEVLRLTKGCKEKNKEGLIIVRHRLGFVLANAGVDMSNVSQHAGISHSLGFAEGREFPRALLLPQNPDRSCERIRSALLESTGVRVGIIINDSHGRSWRNGTIGVALGVAGIPALQDMRGWPDLYGRKLKTTEVGYSDEIASAASLLMGQSKEGRPIVHMRGLKYEPRSASVQELLRPKESELFL